MRCTRTSPTRVRSRLVACISERLGPWFFWGGGGCFFDRSALLFLLRLTSPHTMRLMSGLVRPRGRRRRRGGSLGSKPPRTSAGPHCICICQTMPKRTMMCCRFFTTRLRRRINLLMAATERMLRTSLAFFSFSFFHFLRSCSVFSSLFSLLSPSDLAMKEGNGRQGRKGRKRFIHTKRGFDLTIDWFGQVPFEASRRAA